MKKLASLFLALTLSLGLCVPALAAEFSDVPSDHPFRDAIMDCAGKGIVGGYADETFRPTNTVTKNHFCAMLARAFFPEAVAKYDMPQYRAYGSFAPSCYALFYSDVLNYTSFQFYFADSNVMSSGISRYDMALLLANILKAKGISVSDAEKSAAASGISDYSSIPSNYRDAVASAAAKGLIGGYSDGNFYGDRTMNRGQAAVVIYRLQSLVPVQSAPTPADVPAGRTLANGKPITVANVLEILDQLKAQYPTGTDFVKGYNGLGSGRNPRNNCIAQITNQYWSAQNHSLHTSTSMGCGGWAAFVEDSIFGQNATFRKTTFDQIRPGDLKIQTDSKGYLMHVGVVQSELFPDPYRTIYYGGNYHESVPYEELDHYITRCYYSTDASSGKDGYRLFWDGLFGWTIDDRNPSVIFGASGGYHDYYTAYPD